MPARIDKLRYLEDVDTTGVAGGDTLTWDAVAQMWVPGAGGGGGGAGLIHSYGRSSSQTGTVVNPTPTTDTALPGITAIPLDLAIGDVLLMWASVFVSAKGTSTHRIRGAFFLDGTLTLDSSAASQFYSIPVGDGTKQQLTAFASHIVTAAGVQDLEFLYNAALGASSTTFGACHVSVLVIRP